MNKPRIVGRHITGLHYKRITWDFEGFVYMDIKNIYKRLMYRKALFLAIEDNGVKNE